MVAFSQRVTDTIALTDSEIVFAGYGVQAPEYQWDDFKDLDVKGKTLIVLVDDPPVPATDSQTNRPSDPADLDPKTFGGKAMTYYGRWTYKYDKAAELGAAGVFIVHETGPAGYPFNVVQGFGGERFSLVTPDKSMGRAAVQGWLSLEAATALLKSAGQDFTALKEQARTRAFKPVPLRARASMSFTQKLRTLDSQNVVAKITGANPALKNEYVIYTGHWDHFGIGTEVKGDRTYNGARDNATGTALLIALAKAFKDVKPAPKRSVILLAVTAEEQGLLGSEYREVKFPLYPLAKTVANINADAMNVWGPTKDLTIIGLGNSDLRRLRARGREGTGARAPARPRAREGLLLPLRPLQLREGRRPGAEPRRGYRVRRQARGLRQAEARAVHDQRLPPALRPGEGRLEPRGDGRRREVAVCGGLSGGQRGELPGVVEGAEFRAVRERSLRPIDRADRGHDEAPGRHAVTSEFGSTSITGRTGQWHSHPSACSSSS